MAFTVSLFVFILLISSKAIITSDDKELIDAKLGGFSQLLENNYNYLQSNVKNSTACSSQTTFNLACNNTNTIWSNSIYPPSDLIPNPNYNNEMVNINDTVVKIKYGTNQTQSILNEICFVNSQKSIWISNLEISQDSNNFNYSGVTWQYYGGNSSIAVFSPSFMWSSNASNASNCATNKDTDYDPRYQPWYISATSPQKNIILMIDLSDTLHDQTGIRLVRMKQSAILLLKELTYRDFVGILAYTDHSKYYTSTMIRATQVNIDVLVTYIQSLEVVQGAVADLAGAFTDAYAMLDSSLSQDLTSQCHNLFFVMSSGANDFTNTAPIDVVKQNTETDVIVFSNIYLTNSSQGGIFDLAQVSCYTKGNLYTVSSDEDATLVVTQFNKYLASATNNKFVRWSEIYNNVVSNTRTITGSFPIYVDDTLGLRSVYGVTAIDIDVSILLDINSNMTELDIQNYLISQQSCPPLEITTAFLESIQTKETCSTSPSTSSGESSIAKNKPVYVTISVFLAIFIIVLPCITAYIRDKSLIDFHGFIASWIGFGMFVMCLWALCVFWIHMFPQIIKHETWIKTTFKTESIKQNPYRCCDTVNCRSCEEYFGATCNSLMSSLQEGPCQNGYHCCANYCYDCNCYTSCSTDDDGYTHCHNYCFTCCECSMSVNHRRCDVVCGSCYDPVATKSFVDANGTLHYVYSSTHCGRDDVACVNAFIEKEGPVGKLSTGYYNPYNMNQFASSVAYSTGVMIAFWFPTSIIIATTFIVLCWLISVSVDECRNSNCFRYKVKTNEYSEFEQSEIFE